MSDVQSDSDVVAAMRRWGGGFVQALAEAAVRADAENLSRLKAAFPEYWEEYRQMSALQKEGISR